MDESIANAAKEEAEARDRLSIVAGANPKGLISSQAVKDVYAEWLKKLETLRYWQGQYKKE
jgi:hypothetical protein